jgi:hypothetical protein
MFVKTMLLLKTGVDSLGFSSFCTGFGLSFENFHFSMLLPMIEFNQDPRNKINIIPNVGYHNFFKPKKGNWTFFFSFDAFLQNGLYSKIKNDIFGNQYFEEKFYNLTIISAHVGLKFNLGYKKIFYVY